MPMIALAAKSALAVMLLVAGGAKLADLDGFAGTVRLFIPRRGPRWIREQAAPGVAVTELVAGAVSLSAPGLHWVNLAVFALGIVFVAISAIGYARYRGRSCRCFGALSRRKFDWPGIFRSIAIAAVAAVGTAHIPPGSVRISVITQILLLAVAALLAAVAFTAARALAVSRDAQPRLAP